MENDVSILGLVLLGAFTWGLIMAWGMQISEEIEEDEASYIDEQDPKQ